MTTTIETAPSCERKTGRRDALVALARGWTGPQGIVAKAAPKKQIGIEALLAWTYREELPKARRLAMGPPELRSGWGPVARQLEELSLAGLDDNHFGVVPDFTAASFPHDDALLVHEAVLGLDMMGLELPDAWNPIEDHGPLDGHAESAIARAFSALTLRAADGTCRLRFSPRRLVFRHAIMGGTPDWRIEQPVARIYTEYGKPKWFLRETRMMDGACGPTPYEVEIDGYNAKAQRPKPDAYQKTILDPDPHAGIIARAEYEVWHAALGILVDDLKAVLGTFVAVDSERFARPWMTPPLRRKGRILSDLTSVNRYKQPAARKRKRR